MGMQTIIFIYGVKKMNKNEKSNDNISVFISEEKLKNRISEIGMKLTELYKNETVTVICTLKGAVVFTADLVRKMDCDVRLEFIAVSSYEGMDSTGRLNMKYPLEGSAEGKNILLVEDILDTGRTLKYLKEYILSQNPKSLKLVTLLDKPDRRTTDIQADIVGFTIPDKFVVGYGLDYDQKYRNLPYVGIVE